MEQDTITTVPFRPTRQECVSGIRRTTAANRVLWVMAVVAAALVGVGAAVHQGSMVGAGAAALLVCAYSVAVAPELSGRKLRQRVEDMTFAFSEAGVRVTTATSNGEQAWSHFSQLYADSDMFRLRFRHRRTVYLIPRRAFASPEEAEAFRALAVGRLASP